MPDPSKIEQGFRLILEGIGEDALRPGLKDTPRRIAELYQDLFRGLDPSLARPLSLIEGEIFDEMVALAGVPFHSMCEHHFLPFFGKVHIAYIPKEGRMTGLSDLGRMVDLYARRPQIQERMTAQLADHVVETLTPQGVMVVMEAEHLCLSMRGIKKAGVPVVTSAVRGIFRKNAKTRQEFLSLIRLNGPGQ
ncbi:MAG: GTP cyclohydrolase I FolE [Leptospirillum sp.]|uniref:GTP cyclohydrolase 1 n=1 Tax=Leptospirillum ferriphilum TaxID=178606 RepID=A0A7C3QRB6_9BACT